MGCDILEAAVTIARNKYPECKFQVFNGRNAASLGSERFDVVHMREFYPFTRSSDFERQKDLIRDYIKIVKGGVSSLLSEATGVQTDIWTTAK